jgi:hypothetical protein
VTLSAQLFDSKHRNRTERRRRKSCTIKRGLEREKEKKKKEREIRKEHRKTLQIVWRVFTLLRVESSE